MHNDKGARFRSDPSGKLGGINVVCGGMNVGENRLRAQGADGAAGGDEGECRNYYLISGSNAARTQSQNQRIGPGRHSDAMFDLTPLSKFPLQRINFTSQHELLGSQHPINRFANFASDARILGREIQLRDRLAGSVRVDTCG